MTTHDFDETIQAIWCIDSETGNRMLINLKTGQVITPIKSLEGEDDGN
jgi:hypothetical protein